MQKEKYHMILSVAFSKINLMKRFATGGWGGVESNGNGERLATGLQSDDRNNSRCSIAQ